MDNMAAIDSISLQCRQLAARLNEQDKKLKVLEDGAHTRLLRVEQALGLAQGVGAPMPAPDRVPVAVAPMVAAAARHNAPGVPRRIQPITTTGEPTATDTAPVVPAQPAPAIATQLLDIVRTLSPETADAILHALSGAKAPASQPPPAVTGADDWLAAEHPGAPPAGDVVTTHIDHG
jgi:hypothetical protein